MTMNEMEMFMSFLHVYMCSYVKHFMIFFMKPYLTPPGLTMKDGIQRFEITALDIDVEPLQLGTFLLLSLEDLDFI